MLISQAFSAYATDVIAMKNQSAKTEENHFVCMRALLVFFGDVQMESLSFSMIRDWKMALDERRSPQTVRNYCIKLRCVLSYMTIRGFPVLPPEQLPVPKRKETIPFCLTPGEVAQCIDATQRVKNKLIVSLLYASGIRISELCSLNLGQLAGGCFTIIGKGGKARLCFYDARADHYASLYFKTRSDNNQALILSDQGKRISPGIIQETFKTIRKQTGLNVHPHSLRHSFATNLLSNNTNLYHVSRMLGHSQLNTTAQYLHVIDPDLQKIYSDKHSI